MHFKGFLISFLKITIIVEPIGPEFLRNRKLDNDKSHVNIIESFSYFS